MKNLKKMMISLSGFLFFNWISFLIIRSLLSFFHFNLGHDLATIDEWNVDNIWKLIITTKLSSYFLIKAFIPEIHKRALTILNRSYQKISNYYVFMFAVLISYCLLIDPVVSKSEIFYFSNTIWSLVGSFTLLLIDFLVLTFIFDQSKNKSSRVNLLSLILFIFFAYAQNEIFFPDIFNNYLFYLLNLLFIVYLNVYKKVSLKVCTIYSFFIYGIICSFLGKDLFWGVSYSIFKPTTIFSNASLILSLLVGYVYLFKLSFIKQKILVLNKAKASQS